MTTITIRDVRTILTNPRGSNLVVVKIETSEPGLYGLGCATFTQRHLAVKTAIDDYLKPLLLDKNVHLIEDLWQMLYQNSYWRNSPVLNAALSGVDIALWDIKGKLANMPVYQLFGGKCREGAAVYRHADGANEEALQENVQSFIDQGYHFIRCQMGGYGFSGYGGRKPLRKPPENALPGVYFDPGAYVRSVPHMFEHLRNTVGNDVELLHDVHERLPPIEAVRLAKQLEPYRLFFLEDPLPPEQLPWFHTMRQQSCTPIAMGELFTHPMEWLPLIKDRLIDFIRVHISQIGGITPARKLAILCEAFGVRTAWHGPGDVSPIGHMANIHLDVTSPNFGIQEFGGFSEQEQEIFPGLPQLRDGYLYPNDAPGLGMDINEKEAAKYPDRPDLAGWTLARTPDGTVVRP